MHRRRILSTSGLAWVTVLALALGVAVPSVPRALGALGAAHLTVTPDVGPPTTKSAARGTGFGAGELVELTFDDAHLAVLRTSGTGTLTTKVKVPAEATPGSHVIRALGRTSGREAQAVFTVRTNWSRFRFSVEHTGYNPYENVLGPGTVSGLGLRWAGQADDGINSSPSVVDGRVYVGSAYGKFYAFDATTGELAWRQVLGGASAYPSPTVQDGVVYEAASGALWAMDAADGTVLWIAPGGSFSSPALAGGVVYVGSVGASAVYAIDAATGNELWVADFGGGIFGGPAVWNGRVYVGGAYDLTVHALDADTGAVLWSAYTANYLYSSPAVVDGVVYIGADDEGSSDGVLWALDAITGDTLWTGNTGGGANSSPAVADGRVYIGSEDGRVFAFDATTGAKLWAARTGGEVDSSPAVANGVVYAGSMDSSLYALDAVTGQILWSYATGAGILSSPAVADGVVYVGSFDSKLYAFGL
jgi:outer membrane protein assembly factor BamB